MRKLNLLNKIYCKIMENALCVVPKTKNADKLMFAGGVFAHTKPSLAGEWNRKRFRGGGAADG